VRDVMDQAKLPASPSWFRGIFGPFAMDAVDMDAAVREAWSAGAASWTGTSLSAQDFAAWVQERSIPVEVLRERPADLYLAAACTRGDAAAVAAFDRAYLQPPGPIGAGKATPSQLDEVRQRLRVKLLAGPTPNIESYRGSGPLGAWVRVAAARVTAHLQESERHAGAGQDSALIDALVHLGADPELAAAKLEHHEEFRAALTECLQALGAREKTLLRMNFNDRMNIDEIGVVYRVHRATVARWLAAIRSQVFECVCQKLSLKLRSSPSEVASLVRLVRSDIDVSIRRLLAGD
jgi:RNA polymerase sigma-70 factor (ECF subfamily)